jgi:hypothetical protein
MRQDLTPLELNARHLFLPHPIRGKVNLRRTAEHVHAKFTNEAFSIVLNNTRFAPLFGCARFHTLAEQNPM